VKSKSREEDQQERLFLSLLFFFFLAINERRFGMGKRKRDARYLHIMCLGGNLVVYTAPDLAWQGGEGGWRVAITSRPSLDSFTLRTEEVEREKEGGGYPDTQSYRKE
jgi:hypothetical protein